jgi:hypothetical protein
LASVGLTLAVLTLADLTLADLASTGFETSADFAGLTPTDGLPGVNCSRGSAAFGVNEAGAAAPAPA